MGFLFIHITPFVSAGYFKEKSFESRKLVELTLQSGDAAGKVRFLEYSEVEYLPDNTPCIAYSLTGYETPASKPVTPIMSKPKNVYADISIFSQPKTATSYSTAPVAATLPKKKALPNITEICPYPKCLAYPISKHVFTTGEDEGIAELMPMLASVQLFLSPEIGLDIIKKGSKLSIPNPKEFTLDFTNGDIIRIYVPTQFQTEFKIVLKKRTSEGAIHKAESGGEVSWRTEWARHEAKDKRCWFITDKMTAQSFTRAGTRSDQKGSKS